MLDIIFRIAVILMTVILLIGSFMTMMLWTPIILIDLIIQRRRVVRYERTIRLDDSNNN